MKNNKEWYKANVLASNSMKKSEKQTAVLTGKMRVLRQISKYEFGVVTDSDIQKPDTTGYKNAKSNDI